MCRSGCGGGGSERSLVVGPEIHDPKTHYKNQLLSKLQTFLLVLSVVTLDYWSTMFTLLSKSLGGTDRVLLSTVSSVVSYLCTRVRRPGDGSQAKGSSDSSGVSTV